MKKYVKHLLLLFILCFTGCEPAYKLSPEEREINFIVKDFAREMKKRYELFFIGEGGNLNGGIQEVEVLFAIYRPLSIAEAREIEVVATERLLAMINSNSKIGPYLAEYPFPANRASITISPRSKANERYLDGSVAYVFTARGQVFYRAAKLETYTTQPPIIVSGELDFEFTPRTITNSVLIPLYQEPYEEALRIVKESGKLLCE